MSGRCQQMLRNRLSNARNIKPAWHTVLADPGPLQRDSSTKFGTSVALVNKAQMKTKTLCSKGQNPCHCGTNVRFGEYGLKAVLSLRV
jgi:hypothetical protein